MIIGVHQPNFFPWLGYFHKIASCDRFMLIDEVKFIKRSYCNRAKIKNLQGEEVWLTIPVIYKDGLNFTETQLVAQAEWLAKAINLLKSAYIKAPYFDKYFSRIEELLSKKYNSVAEMNMSTIKYVCSLLEIKTPLYLQSHCSEMFGRKNNLNLNVTKYLEGDVYLSGTGAIKYNDESLFEKAGVELRYQKFSLPAYPQQGKEFVSGLSILDMLFNIGAEEIKLILNDQVN